MNSKIIEVIAVTEGDKITYFTKEGIEIGGLIGNNKIEPEKKQEYKNKGAVLLSPTPETVKKQKEIEAEKALTLEERLKYGVS